MPTIIDEGTFRFVIYTRELDYEPPHVHIIKGNVDVCRLDLNSGQFMDPPPPGNYRDILKIYYRYADIIRREWDRIHKR